MVASTPKDRKLRKLVILPKLLQTFLYHLKVRKETRNPRKILKLLPTILKLKSTTKCHAHKKKLLSKAFPLQIKNQTQKTSEMKWRKPAPFLKQEVVTIWEQVSKLFSRHLTKDKMWLILKTRRKLPLATTPILAKRWKHKNLDLMKFFQNWKQNQSLVKRKRCKRWLMKEVTRKRNF